MARRSWGEGSVFYDNTHKYWVWKGTYLTPSGEKKTKSFTAQRQKDLKPKVDAFLLQVANGEFTNASTTVAAWVQQWLEVIVRPSVKKSTHGIYKQKLQYVIDAFGERKLPTLTSLELQAFFNALVLTGGKTGTGLSPTTVNTCRRYFRTCCTDAIKNGLLKTNPVEGTKPQKKVKKEIVVIDEAEVLRFLAVAKEGKYIYHGITNRSLLNYNKGTEYAVRCYYNLINLALATGMRISELRGLSWSNINFSKRFINVKEQYVQTADDDMFDEPKTEKSKRKIVVGVGVMEELKSFKKYQKEFADFFGDQFDNKYNLVFTNTVGNPISLTNFRKRYWSKMLAVAGIQEGFTFHCMRHTHATILLKNNVNVLVVSERLGHSSVTVTMNIYAHILKSMEQTAPTVWEQILNPSISSTTNEAELEAKGQQQLPL